jgi:hypothetical protein
MSFHPGIPGNVRLPVSSAAAIRKHRRDVSAQLWSMA